MGDLREDLRAYFDHLSDRALAAQLTDPRHARVKVTDRLARPRVFVALVGIAVVSVAATLIVTLDSGPDTPRVETRPDAASPFSVEQLKAMLMPITAADLELNQGGIVGFNTRVHNKAASECLVSNGYSPLPDTPGAPPPGSHYAGFEDPDSLRRYGFDGPTGPITIDPNAPQAPVVPNDVAEKCGQQASAATARLQSLMEPFFTNWNAAIQTAEGSPSVKAAWEQWVVCIRAKGYDVNSENEFLAEVDRTRQAAPGGEQGRAVDRKLATDYADCLDQGVVAARTTARSAAREAFLASHEREFLAVQEQLPGVVTALSKRYGVAFGNETSTTTTTSTSPA